MDLDIYNRLIKCAIFKTNSKVKVNQDKKKVSLDPDTAAILENGIALGKYLLVLKEALVLSAFVDTAIEKKQSGLECQPAEDHVNEDAIKSTDKVIELEASDIRARCKHLNSFVMMDFRKSVWSLIQMSKV